MISGLVRNSRLYALSIVLFICVTYFSWFTWFAARIGGGLLVYGLYFLPAVIFLLERLVRSGSTSIPARPIAIVGISGSIFLVLQGAAHLVLKASNDSHGFAIDPLLVNLLGVGAAVIVAIGLLQDPKRSRVIVLWSLLPVLLVNVLLTYRLIQTDEAASRMMATQTGVVEYGGTGASGFYIVNSVALLLPVLLRQALFVRRGRVWWALGLIVGVWFVSFSGYLLTMVAAALALFSYLLFLAPRWLRYPAVMTLGLWIAIGGLGPLAPALRAMAERVTFYEVSRRLSDLADLFTIGVTSAPSLERVLLYGESWNAFLSSPFVGVYLFDPNAALSGHSTVLDVLGGTGLVGLLMLLLVGAGAYRLGASIVVGRSSLAALRACYFTLTFIACVNPILTQPAILFTAVAVVPLMCYSSAKRSTESAEVASFRRPFQDGERSAVGKDVAIAFGQNHGPYQSPLMPKN